MSLALTAMPSEVRPSRPLSTERRRDLFRTVWLAGDITASAIIEMRTLTTAETNRLLRLFKPSLIRGTLMLDRLRNPAAAYGSIAPEMMDRIELGFNELIDRKAQLVR